MLNWRDFETAQYITPDIIGPLLKGRYSRTAPNSTHDIIGPGLKEHEGEWHRTHYCIGMCQFIPDILAFDTLTKQWEEDR